MGPSAALSPPSNACDWICVNMKLTVRHRSVHSMPAQVSASSTFANRPSATRKPLGKGANTLSAWSPMLRLKWMCLTTSLSHMCEVSRKKPARVRVFLSQYRNTYLPALCLGSGASYCSNALLVDAQRSAFCISLLTPLRSRLQHKFPGRCIID